MPIQPLRLPFLGAALSLLLFSSCSSLPEDAGAADAVSAAKSEVRVDPTQSIPESDPLEEPAESQPIEEMRWGPGTSFDAREMPPLPPEYQRMLEQYYEKLQPQQPRVR